MNRLEEKRKSLQEKRAKGKEIIKMAKRIIRCAKKVLRKGIYPIFAHLGWIRGTAKENRCVRSHPSAKAEKVGVIKKGMPCRILKRKPYWVYIRYGKGKEGWIPTRYIAAHILWRII